MDKAWWHTYVIPATWEPVQEDCCKSESTVSIKCVQSHTKRHRETLLQKRTKKQLLLLKVYYSGRSSERMTKHTKHIKIVHNEANPSENLVTYNRGRKIFMCVQKGHE